MLPVVAMQNYGDMMRVSVCRRDVAARQERAGMPAVPGSVIVGRGA